MEKTLNFAVIGCGSIAELAHFPSIAKTEGAKLKACCDIDKETAKSAFLILPDWKNNQGVIKTNPKYVNKIRVSLALVKSIKNKKMKIKTIKVSGILKKARGA